MCTVGCWSFGYVPSNKACVRCLFKWPISKCLKRQPFSITLWSKPTGLYSYVAFHCVCFFNLFFSFFISLNCNAKPAMSKVTLYILGMQEKIFTNVLFYFFFLSFDLVPLKYRKIINYACFFIFQCIYLFSNKYKLYTLLTFKYSIALLFLLLPDFPTLHSTVLFFTKYLGQNSWIPFKICCVHICFVYSISVHQVFFFLSPKMYEAFILARYAIKPYFL